MQRIESVEEMRAAADVCRRRNQRIALVPTMGALHAGHASLIKLAREKADVVVTSIFVNPLQFGPSEDSARFPRDLPNDLAVCEQAGVTVVFTPTAPAMFPRGYSTHVIEDAVSKPLEGLTRPSLFRGMLTGTIKLLNIVRPDVLVLGEEEPQQVAVVRKAMADLSIPVEVVAGPTIREADGLACSARNRFLSPGQRAEALAAWQALGKVREMVAQGVRSADRLIAEATHILTQKRRVRVIYISVVDRTNFEPMREITPGQSLMVMAVWVDEVRLIDSLPI
ncbi:MAG: pantoate--beta-alanine ligase [Opitutaceae bacterium]|nr:pantoate--beta-alanine ligase [Opitutaceae bacterium]